MKNKMIPPPGAVEVFMGCGKINSNLLKVGAVATPAELFDQRDYPYFEFFDAKAVRNYYAYYSTSTGEPIGFSKTPRILLVTLDKNYLPSESKLSRSTVNSDHLWRCGSDNGYSDDFWGTFKIVFYYR
jgi:hypothetical protein